MSANPASESAVYEPLLQEPDAEEGRNDEVVGAGPRWPQHDQVDSQVVWIHFVLGCAVLLPWNVLITATPYFMTRLKGSAFESPFSSYLSITFTVANFFFLAHATITSKQTSPSSRIFVHTSILMLLVSMLTLSTAFDSSPSIFFAFVILNGIAQACAGSYLQTAVVATASLFGPHAMQPLMSGQAFVGVVVSGVQVLSAMASVSSASASAKAGLEYDEEKAASKSAALFFGLSTLFLCGTLFAVARLVRLPVYKTVVRNLEQVKRNDSSNLEQHDIKHDMPRIWRVLKANAPYEFAVAYVFLVTLAVFPPITASVQPANPARFSPLVFTSIHFFLFNVGDLGGRYICAIPRLLVWGAHRLVGISLLRTLFIPLFLLCNIKRNVSDQMPFPGIPGDTSVITADGNVVAFGDIFFYLLLLLFGLSNGYVSSMSMIAAPNVDRNPRLKGKMEDVDVAATLATFFLVGGLAVGSAVSFAVRAQVCACNPFIG